MKIYLCTVQSSRRFRIGSYLYILAVLFLVSAFSASIARGDDSAVLDVKQIEGVANSKGVIGIGTPDNTFENGWKWVFNITVPTDEVFLKMKFSDWTSGGEIIPVGENLRFYSSQSSNISDAEHSIMLDGADKYSDISMNLVPSNESDLDPLQNGRQIQVTVEARIPVDAVSGSYSTSYGITSSKDSTPPVITLLGSSPVAVQVGSPYNDAGATALDDIDGDITSSIVLTGRVNTNEIKTYTLIYNVTDSSGNIAVPITRTVNVTPDVSVLTTNISLAQTLHDDAVEGIEVGQYAIDSKKALQTAIDDAIIVRTNALNAKESQATVDAAVSALSDAATIFSSGKVTDDGGVGGGV